MKKNSKKNLTSKEISPRNQTILLPSRWFKLNFQIVLPLLHTYYPLSYYLNSCLPTLKYFNNIQILHPRPPPLPSMPQM